MTVPKTYFHTLDTLRGVAAINVAIFHYHWNVGKGSYLAVDFFLVLSGFVLAHTYLHGRSSTSAVGFISHRLARLYPLHVFTLLTFLLAYYLTKQEMPSYQDGNLMTFLENLTLTQNVGINRHGLNWNYPAWSISVEFWVNILFIFYVRKTTRNITLFVIASLSYLLIVSASGHLDVHFHNYFHFINAGLLRGTAAFFLGILAYRMYLYVRDSRTLQRHASWLELASIALLLLIVLPRDQSTSNLDFFAPYLFLFMVPLFALEQGLLSRLLRYFRHLGTISYSLYLNQFTVLFTVNYLVADWHINSKHPLWVFLAVLIAYSALTYRFIERPARRAGREWLSRLDRQVHQRTG